MTGPDELQARIDALLRTNAALQKDCDALRAEAADTRREAAEIADEAQKQFEAKAETGGGRHRADYRAKANAAKQIAAAIRALINKPAPEAAATKENGNG